MKTIKIEPVTRVEGEARVVIVIDEEKHVVRDAYYQVMSLRGFEAFCRGRPVEELPRITSTICGVCSWAHHLASAKAVDEVYGRKPTVYADNLRELAMLAQICDSHLLHFAFLALPDILSKNIREIVIGEPKLLSMLIKARSSVVNIEKILGGKPIHPSFTVPGGVARKLSREDIARINNLIRELYVNITASIDYFNERILKSTNFRKLIENEAFTIKSYYMGLIDTDGSIGFYRGKLRIIDPDGRELALLEPRDYTRFIEERVEAWSYSKFPYVKMNITRSMDGEYGLVRVGPLARFNISTKIPLERSRFEYERLIETLGGKPIHNSQVNHWIRLLEVLYSTEKMFKLIEEISNTEGETVNTSGEPRYEGVGIVEAPRGTLIHHYKTNEDFITTDINVITPTTFNNPAINREIRKVCESSLHNILSSDLEPSYFNDVEVAIRAYDPCNSCSTHLHIISSDGRKSKSMVISR
ncbi:MAG: Ni/Fe hydrogenase subunit alpha [Desulfurococcaceae archaeon]